MIGHLFFLLFSQAAPAAFLSSDSGSCNFFPSVSGFLFYVIQLSQVEYLIDIHLFSSFCVDRKKKQERTANTLRRRTNGLSGVCLICYRRLPLLFAQLTPRHLSWQTCEAVLIMISSSFRIGLDLRHLNYVRSWHPC